MLDILTVFVAQFVAACLFNILTGVPVPKNHKEFLIMTFLPSTIYYKFTGKYPEES